MFTFWWLATTRWLRMDSVLAKLHTLNYILKALLEY